MSKQYIEAQLDILKELILDKTIARDQDLVDFITRLTSDIYKKGYEDGQYYYKMDKNEANRNGFSVDVWRLRKTIKKYKDNLTQVIASLPVDRRFNTIHNYAYYQKTLDATLLNHIVRDTQIEINKIFDKDRNYHKKLMQERVKEFKDVKK